MKCVILAIVLGLQGPQGGGPADGLQLYRDGKFADAAAAFRTAIERDGDAPELQWNLALASWRAGDLATAEVAAEKYAATSKHARTDLHAGLLGAVRHDEAKVLQAQADGLAVAPPPPAAAGGEPPADPLPLLEQALAKASQAKDWFVKGAAANATPESLRNTERALRTVDELQKKIDELKKQREEQKQDEEKKDEKKEEEKEEEKKQDEQQKNEENDEKKNDEKESEEQSKPDESKSEEKGEQQQTQEPPEGQQGEEKPEPKPEDPQQDPAQPPKDPQGNSGEQPPQGEPKGEAGQRSDAPGEGREGKALTSEQLARLLDDLKKADEKLREIRLRAKSQRRPVERDW